MRGATTEARVLGFVEALEVVLHHAAGVRVTGAEKVGLLASAGRVLAEEVRADRDQPAFDRATRDGFAVRAAEWTAGRRLRVAGLVRAGETWAGKALSSGEAVEIMTGAAVPSGADAVAMVEHAELGEGLVWAAAGRGLSAEENIVRRASEARRGEALLAAGRAMGAAEIALAAACGCAEIAVRKRPVVAIVATGDELVEVEETPGDSQIRNSNGTALAAMVEAAGGEARRLAIARDSRESLQERIAEGRGSDLLLLSGGVSVGKYDLVEEVLAEFGAEFFFRGVRMQPGRPVVFGRLRKAASQRDSESASQQDSESASQQDSESASQRDSESASQQDSESASQQDSESASQQDSESASQRVGELADAREWVYFFGLPGNPVSTLVTFQCFVGPMLRALCGAGAEGPRFVQATLAEEVKGKAGLTRILPAILRHDLERPEVRIVGSQGSGDLAANARANCYAVLEDGRSYDSGDVISVLLR
jgi:molybdopterin molybdotransferase